MLLLLVKALLVSALATASAVAGASVHWPLSVSNMGGHQPFILALTRESSMNGKLGREITRQSPRSTGSSRPQIECVELPCIEHVPTASGSPARLTEALGLAELVLLTSPKAAAMVISSRKFAGEPSPSFATIGGATSSVLRQQGIVPVFEAPVPLAASLAKHLPVHFKHARILHPVSSLADGALENTLVRRGFTQVARLDAYTTTTPQWSETSRALAQSSVDAVTFGSPSAVRGWVRNGGNVAVPAFVIGSTTAATAAKEGFKEVHTARPKESRAVPRRDPGCADYGADSVDLVRRWAGSVVEWVRNRNLKSANHDNDR